MNRNKLHSVIASARFNYRNEGIHFFRELSRPANFYIRFEAIQISGMTYEEWAKTMESAIKGFFRYNGIVLESFGLIHLQTPGFENRQIYECSFFADRECLDIMHALEVISKAQTTVGIMKSLRHWAKINAPACALTDLTGLEPGQARDLARSWLKDQCLVSAKI